MSDTTHLFGTRPGEFDVAERWPVFDKVFDLYVTPGVVAHWDTSGFDTFISSVMDNDSTDVSDDLFAIVWDYFCKEDADANDAYAGVRYVVGIATHTKITITLYDRNDLGSPCCYNPKWCSGYSGAVPGLTLAISNNQTYYSMDTVLGGGFAHELQHVCWAANGYGNTCFAGYNCANESVSALAEYLVGFWRAPFDLPYDSSILRNETCDVDSKYRVEKLWLAYLYETFSGDDLIQAWIEGGDMSLDGLATALDTPSHTWVEGADSDEKLVNLFSYFAVAKFCNAPDFGSNNRFGTDAFNSLTDFEFFTDVNPVAVGKEPDEPVDCPPYEQSINNAWWNVRILPPIYTLGSAEENGMTTVSGIYTDGDDTADPNDGDGSMDYVNVYVYGTDYIVFEAGSYYQDGEAHELHFSLRGEHKQDVATYGELRRAETSVWVVGYDSTAQALQLSDDHILFIDRLNVTNENDSAKTDVTITDFGRTVRSVVVVIAPVYTHAPINQSYGADQGLEYEYSYGVVTPGEGRIDWKGDVFVLADHDVGSDSLIVAAGTNVRVAASDPLEAGADSLRVELLLSGVLHANGTAASPVTIRSWNPTTTSDWAGISIDSPSPGIVLNHCLVADAVTGIMLEGVEASIDSSTVSDCAMYGIRLMGDANLDISHSSFLRDSVGVYVEDNDSTGLIHGLSTFDDNEVGVAYNNSSGPTIDECIITNNTTGVKCDNASTPTIQHCIEDTTTYHGTISGNVGGVVCLASSAVQITQNDIKQNTNGVMAATGGEADLAAGGYNRLKTNGYHVINLNANAVSAEDNYWYWNTGSPDFYPKPSKIYGSVNYAPAIPGPSNPMGTSLADRPVAEPTPDLPLTTGFLGIHPNPFNPQVQIRYAIAAPGERVQMSVYNVAGQLVVRLVDGFVSPGDHVAVWDGVDGRGNAVASAVYFVRMRFGATAQTRKIVLLK